MAAGPLCQANHAFALVPMNWPGATPTPITQHAAWQLQVKMVSPQEMIFAAERDTVTVIDVRSGSSKQACD